MRWTKWRACIDAGARIDTWHVGADEVPDGAWARSPASEALFNSGQNVKHPGELMPYFLRRINGLALARGLALRVPVDSVTSTTFGDGGATTRVQNPADFAGNRVSVNAYTPLRYHDDRLAPLADEGYQVVITGADYIPWGWTLIFGSVHYAHAQRASAWPKGSAP